MVILSFPQNLMGKTICHLCTQSESFDEKTTSPNVLQVHAYVGLFRRLQAKGHIYLYSGVRSVQKIYCSTTRVAWWRMCVRESAGWSRNETKECKTRSTERVFCGNERPQWHISLLCIRSKSLHHPMIDTFALRGSNGIVDMKHHSTTSYAIWPASHKPECTTE